MKAEGNENDSIFLCQKALLSPIEELDELEVLERHTSLDRDSRSSCAKVAKIIADTTFPGSMVFGDDRKSWDLSQINQILDAPPIWTLPSPRLPAFPTGGRRMGIPMTLGREEVTQSPRQDCSSVADTSMSLASRNHVSEPPHLASSSRTTELPLPVFPRITLPPFSLSPTGIDKMLKCQLASSKLGSGHSDMEVSSAAPDPSPLLDGLLSNAQNGEFHSTGNCCSKRTWKYLYLRSIIS